MADNALALIDELTRQLATVTDLETIKEVRDKSQAIRAYHAKRNEDREEKQRAALSQLISERRLGELLKGMEKHAGGRPSENRLHDETSLAELGITKIQSHRWQTEASLPEEQFRVWVAESFDTDRDLTSAALYRLGKQLLATGSEASESETLEGTVTDLALLPRGTFGCIYADPPWKYGNQGTRAATNNHYKTMSVDELCEMPVAGLAAADSHLHLWTTNAFLPESFRVMESWGFEYRSCYIWVKPQMGIGNYWRVSHELLLLGVRGAAKRFNARDQISWGQFDRTRHSAKPEGVREIIERVSSGPYLELFGRKAIDGWTVYGDQIEQNVFSSTK